MVGPGVIVVVAAFTLVVNLLLSPRMLGEMREWADWVAVFFVVSGICLAITAVETNPGKMQPNVAEIEVMVSSEKALAVWLSLLLAIMGLTWACQFPSDQSGPQGTIGHVVFVARPAMSGSMSIMLAAPTSALIMDPGGASGWMWCLPVAMILSTILDVHFVNKSLKYNEALFHAPVCFVLWQITSLVCGAVIYEETKGFEDLQWALAGSGVGATLIGVGVASTRPFPGSPRYRRLQFL